jgi:hypothetical protein
MRSCIQVVIGKHNEYNEQTVNEIKLKKQDRSMRKILLFLALLFISISCFSQSRHVSETTKKIVFSRDGGICNCCGSSSKLEYDHITPFSCGGTSDVSNIQLLCQQCNRSKSNSCICKIHNRRVGTNCCDKKKTNKSSVTSSQCLGTTQKGNRCKKKTTNSNGRCHLH